jgi:uncharacterized membrane protein (UPF0127 family)
MSNFPRPQKISLIGKIFPVLLLSARLAGAFEPPPGAKEVLLVLPDGFKVRAELARTPEEQSRGLMFRKGLKEERGMLFVFADAGEKSFWMKNTFVELDIVFLDKDLKAGKIFHRVTPSRSGQSDFEVSRVSAPARYVLELAGGVSRGHGLRPGSRIKSYFPAQKRQPGIRPVPAVSSSSKTN